MQRRLPPTIWALLTAAVLLAVLVMAGATDGLDAWIGQRLHDPAPHWLAITVAGDVPVLMGAVAVAAAWLWRDRGRTAAWRMLAVGGFGWAGTNALKLAFARARPEGGAVEVASHAFPSGHALGAMAVYVAWARLAAPGTGLQRLAVGLGLLVGVSRVTLGVHHATDVVAGWCLALALVLAVCPPATPDHRTPTNT